MTLDWHAETREVRRRKRRYGMRTQGKSVFLIQDQIRKRGQQVTDPVTPDHSGHRVVVNGHGNRWCETCRAWAFFKP